MRVKIAIAVGLLCAAAIAAALLASDKDQAGEIGPPAGRLGDGFLRFESDPAVLAPALLPDDRIVYGVIQNDSLRKLRASTERFSVRDSDGKRMVGSIRFAAGYAHGLYGAFQQPESDRRGELLRLGIAVVLESGATAPVTISYRVRDPIALPATLYFKRQPVLELPFELTEAATPSNAGATAR